MRTHRLLHLPCLDGLETLELLLRACGDKLLHRDALGVLIVIECFRAKILSIAQTDVRV